MQKSHWILLSIFWTTLTWYLTTTPQPVVLEVFWLNSLMMMTAHFVFFGIQSTLLSLSLLPTAYCILITSIYGALVEFNQYYVPGRSADPLDWILDTLGAITFLFFLKKLQSKKYVELK